MTLPASHRIVEALRDYGLTVIEDPGWTSRGTGHPFQPFAQAWHHDALTEQVSDARALDIMRHGRPDLRGPLCNGWIDSDSRVVLVAAGNANHAGRNEADVIDRLRRGLAPLGDARDDPDRDSVIGNPHLWGWECRNAGTGTDVWDQLDAMERAGAALCDVNGWPAAANAAHRELTARKIDPAGFDMRRFRADIAHLQAEHSTPTPQEDDPMQFWLMRAEDAGEVWIVPADFSTPPKHVADESRLADVHTLTAETGGKVQILNDGQVRVVSHDFMAWLLAG
jgi:hypothetical protein